MQNSPPIRRAAEEVDVAKKRAKSSGRSDPEAVRKHGREVIGLLLIALGVLLSLALISFHPTDPSLNTASAEPVRNWIGLFGAVVSDGLFQLLGVTSFVTATVCLVFGGRLLVRRRSPVRWHEMAGLVSTVVFTALLAHLIVGSVSFRGEPLPTGGALGKISAGLLSDFIGRTGAVVVASFGLLITLKLALDISLADIAGLARGPLARGLSWVTGICQRTGQAISRRFRGLVASMAGRAGDLKAARVRRAAARKERERQQKERDVEEELVAEAQSSVLEAVQVTAPRIVDPADATPPVSSESLEGLDAVETSEMTSAPALGVVEVEGEPSEPEAEVAETVPEESVADGPVIVESEHLQAPPNLDVDSLRGWSPDIEFRVPPLALLDPVSSSRSGYSSDELHKNAGVLEAKLRDYGVQGRVVEIHPGPVITMYEFEPAPGVKIARIAGLSDDLSMALKAEQVRIVAPLPGKGVVGVEVPNKRRETVFLREVLAHDAAAIARRRLPIAVGKDIVGKPTIADLAKMPHLLIAGTTGSGKSVAVNSMLMSLLLSRTPDEVRLILIDPKMIEFVVYENIPHLLLPVVTDPKQAAFALRWAVGEMTRRYEMLRFVKKRNIIGFNQRMTELRAAWESEGDEALPWDPEDPGLPFNGPPEPLPYIVIIIDELADLMMVARKDVEDGIVRLAQMARAAGIHLVLATQRPSVDVITGLIKANFPARISFKVSSKVDSRTVLDGNGGENLLGAGDLLMLKPGTSTPQRFHAPLVTVDEINRVCEELRHQAEPAYLENILLAAAAEQDGNGEDAEEYDEFYDRAVAIVSESRRASTSMLQRRLKIGYNRAARIIERMEIEGVVGPADGVKPREVFAQSFAGDI